MRGRLNTRFLLIAVLSSFALSSGWFFAHRYQQERHLSSYLAQATRAEQEKKFERAARLLRAYVLAVPTDIDARVRFAGVLEKTAKSPKVKLDALSVYEQALRQDPSRSDARHRAAELAVELRRIETASEHVSKLLAASDADGRAWFLMGLCHEAKGRYSDAVETYARSGRLEPKPETFIRSAAILRTRLKQEDKTAPDGSESGPQTVLNELVAVLPNSFEAYLARAAYHKTYDPTTGYSKARKDLEIARRLAPDEPPVLLASAQVALGIAAQLSQQVDAKRSARESYWEEARQYLRHGLSKFPKMASLHLALAEVEHQAGRRDEAVNVLTASRKVVHPSDLPEILFALAEQYSEAGDKTGTDELIAQLKKLNQDATRLNHLRGVSLVRQHLWYEGSVVLERVRPLLVDRFEKATQVDLLLAQCYGNLGDTDKQLITYRRAVSDSPLDYRPRFGLAGALAACGRSSEAIEEYRHVTQMERSPANARLALARLLIYQNLSNPKADERPWGEVAHLLAEVKHAVKDALEVSLLEAEVLFARGDAAGAKKLLTTQRDAHPKEPEFWFALAALTDRCGDNKGANALLDEAVRQIGDTPDLRLTRLRVTEYTSADQSAAVISGLAAGAERFSSDDGNRLLRSLAAAYWLIDRPADAARLWDQVAAQRPTELAVRLLRFDAALKLDDDAGMRHALAEIRRIEGNGPIEWYGAATRLIWKARRGDLSGLAEARGLLSAAAARRPGWSRVPMTLAWIDDLEGNTELALEHLKQAVDLGDRQLPNVKRLVQLLDERGRVQEADDVLRRLEAQAPISNDLRRLAAEVSIRLDTDRALSLARKAIGANSKDYRERIWLGRILSAAARTAEAEAEFEAAATIAPDRPEVWTAYVQHLARRKGAVGKAEAVLARAEAAIGGKDLLALALCYEVVGKRDEAEKRYLAAIRTKPFDVRAVRATATFYQQIGVPQKAEPFLRQLLSAELKAGTEEISWARRNLALALGIRPDGPGFEEAIRLLDANAAGGERVDDLRTRALITSTRPGRRQEVITLLEKAEQLKPPQPEHEFLLAKLYEAEGNWPKARDRMLRLIGLQKGKAEYVTAYAHSLIRRGDYGEARVWVDQLADVAGGQPTTVALQTQVLCRLGQAAEALPVVRRYADATDGDPAARALAAAELFDQAFWAGAGRAAADAAETQYRRHHELSKRPEAGLPLAGYYGRHDAPDKALTLCEEALKKCPAEQVVAVAVGAVSGPATRANHLTLVEGWLTRSIAEKPTAPNLRFLLATLREQQSQFPAAEAEYRRLLAQTPGHAPALNNLAFLLAMTGRGTAGVQVAQQALTAAPDSPAEILDTRAVAHLAVGNLAAARKDLEAAITAGGPPTAHYHLAVAYSKLKDKQRAVAELRSANAAGLRPSLLHPLERPGYDQLRAELQP